MKQESGKAAKSQMMRLRCPNFAFAVVVAALLLAGCCEASTQQSALCYCSQGGGTSCACNATFTGLTPSAFVLCFAVLGFGLLRLRLNRGSLPPPPNCFDVALACVGLSDVLYRLYARCDGGSVAGFVERRWHFGCNFGCGRGHVGRVAVSVLPDVHHELRCVLHVYVGSGRVVVRDGIVCERDVDGGGHENGVVLAILHVVRQHNAC